jgi:beta-lactamase superfamily II metal-dependent hydrolase
MSKNNAKDKAICYFLDVGQGTSQVICLGNHRAIIIDTGKNRKSDESPLLLQLDKLKIQRISALVLSHNDADHIGDTKNIIDKYRGRIDKIFLLKDRSPSINNTNKVLLNAVKNEKIARENICYLVADKSSKLFDENSIDITVLYPDVFANLENDKNGTCAIIALTVGTQKVVFSGDAPVEAWKFIVENNEQQNLQILTVPHHGGLFANAAGMQWFFDNIKSKYAIVSVGANTYGHPQNTVIESFVRNNSEVFCTQSVHEYCGGNQVCCGTIIVDIEKDRIDIHNVDELRKNKDKFPKRLCTVR